MSFSWDGPPWRRFWEEGPETQQVEMSMFMKNLSISGGALALFALVNDAGNAPLTITDPLF